MIELISIIAALFELTGIFLLGIKNKYGFILNAVAGTLWITYSLISHNAIGLLLVCSCGIILNSRGLWNWNKGGTK